jgi:hypothetical protein
MWDCPDNQDVGLEAAIIERVRNSSLVEWSCAENVTGLSQSPKLRQVNKTWVGERCLCMEVILEGMVECRQVRMPV